MNYIISQIFIVLCFAMIGVSYLAKNRKLVLFYSLISVLFNAMSYFCLSAWTGFAMIAVALLRNLLFMFENRITNKKLWTETKIKLFKIISLVFLVSISIVFAIVTFDTIFSLFAVFSTITYTYALWQDNVNTYKKLGMVAEISGLIYYAFIKSLFGVILEFIVIVVSIVYLLKINKKTIKEVKEVE